MDAIWAVAGALFGFVAGWLTATEKLRVELFKARLTAYLDICRKCSVYLRLFAESTSGSDDQTDLLIKSYRASSDMTETLFTHAPVVSLPVAILVNQLAAVKREEKFGDMLSKIYAEMIDTMGKDLGTGAAWQVNEGLLNPLRMFKRRV